MAKKKTIIIKDNLKGLEAASKLLRDGGIVVFPTETVYGLGADSFNKKAVEELFKAKGRPVDNPLIVHIAGLEELPIVASNISDIAVELFRRFSPGPLTIVLPRNKNIPDIVTAGLDTVAVRIPSHPTAKIFLELTGTPVAAPSANRSGRPSPTTFEMALSEMDGRADAIIDGGNCAIGLESTVISIIGGHIKILRPGAVTEEMLHNAIGNDIKIDSDYNLSGVEMKKPDSPGMKYIHYKPKAEVYISDKINKLDLTSLFPGMKIGILHTTGKGQLLKEHMHISFKNLEEYAQSLYRSFNEFDRMNVDIIIAEAVEEIGVGRAIMNRLLKASGKKWL